MAAPERQKAVSAFRSRLLELIERSGDSRAGFAARVGMDRSTLSQLLAEGNQRLPRADTVVAIAAAGQVSCDWLLGLSQDESVGTELLRNNLEIESGAASPTDERLMRWHREASGYKIRYIPTTLPDLLKTEAVIAHECPGLAAGPAATTIEQAAHLLDYSRYPETEMEVCCATQTLVAFARGEGMWHSLDARTRRAQLERMIQLADELYPTFRWLLYDGLQHFSAPITLFGSLRAVLYVGNLYFVFNTTEHIQLLTQRFDYLVTKATVQPQEISGFLTRLFDEVV